jgi:hypothetical protein
MALVGEPAIRGDFDNRQARFQQKFLGARDTIFQ